MGYMEMTISDLKELFELHNELRREVGKARMNLSVHWVRAADDNLVRIIELLDESYERLTTRKIIDVLNNNVKEEE